MKTRFRVTLVVITILILLALGIFGYSKTLKKEEVQPKEVLENIEKFGYTLDSLDSEVFKLEFQTLKKIVEEDNIDYTLYAESLAKLFVIDLYTIETKINKNDVGGLEYIYSTKKDNYKLKMIDTLYKEVTDNSDSKRTQELPKVSAVSTSNQEEKEFLLGSNSVDSYQVVLDVEYQKDLGYDSKIQIILVKEGNKLSVAEFSSYQENE